jgi:hypothetical protein
MISSAREHRGNVDDLILALFADQNSTRDRAEGTHLGMRRAVAA